MPLASGTRLGPYEIVSAIGAGGMGEVYRARDTQLHREVAIKILPPAFAQDAARMARFEREAQILAALSHPNIAPIFGIEQGALVMEFVAGEDLHGPLPIGVALDYARQIASALEAAHEKGIVHRDLKPANIRVTPAGAVKLLDFGLAKSTGETPSSAAQSPTTMPTLSMEATAAGAILGTAAYMSPEQARGKPIDRRADIWAFGAVLYEMLCGRPAFPGETVTDIIAGVLTRDPDWSALPASTPPHIRRLIERCLRKDVKTRLQAIGEARIAIDEPPPLTPTAHPQTASRRVWTVAAAALLIGAAADASWGWLRASKTAPRMPVHWVYTQNSAFTLPVLSHDGSRIAMVDDANARFHIAQKALDEAEFKPIPRSDGMSPLDFSPDDQWLLAEDYTGALKRISVSGGEAITVTDSGGPGSWGDDNTIVYAGKQGLMRISSSGANAQALTRIGAAKGETAHRWPRFLPGGDKLLFTVSRGSQNDIALLDLKTGEYHVIVRNGLNASYASGGHILFERDGALFAVPFDAARWTVNGPETPLAAQLASGPNGGGYSVSSNGLLVYVAAGVTRAGSVLAWLDRDGRTQPVSDSQAWGAGRLSPDGRRIAADISAGGVGDVNSREIWVFDVERRARIRIAAPRQTNIPEWTKDGRRVIFGMTGEGNYGVYWAMADGSGKPELLLATSAPASAASFSPDGKQLLYASGGQIWVAPFSNGAAGAPAPLHKGASGDEYYPQISPDGRWLAYVSTESRQQEVYLEPFNGSGERELVSTGGGAIPRWSSNGKELYYRTLDGAWMGVEIQTSPKLHVGLPRVLYKSNYGTFFDAAPDGKRFLVEIVPETVSFADTLHLIVDWEEEFKRLAPERRGL